MKPIQVLEEAKDSVSSLHVVGHEIVTGSVDERMRIYDLRMGMVFVDVIGRISSHLFFPPTTPYLWPQLADQRLVYIRRPYHLYHANP